MMFLNNVLFFFAFLSFCFLSIFNRKIRLGLLKRRGLLKRLRFKCANLNSNKGTIWFHVASAGELEQALPLMDELKAHAPNSFILISYFSPSAEEAVRSETKRRLAANIPLCWDFADYSTLDFSFFVKSFLDIVKPTALIVINKELWPNMLLNCHRRNIPCHLWVANFRKSFTRHLRPLLKYFSDIGVVNNESVSLLRQWDKTLPIRLVGDTRLERVAFRKKHFRFSHHSLSAHIPAGAFIAASLWEEDFSVFLAALEFLEQEKFYFPVVIVPHEPHPDRIIRWKAQISRKVMDFFSPVFIEQVGLLAELYSHGATVFVGGSFKKKVHNVLEPLIYELPLITGPKILNSPEAVDLHRLGILQKTQNEKELSEAIKNLLGDQDLRAQIKDRISQYVQSHSLSSTRYLSSLKID